MRLKEYTEAFGVAGCEKEIRNIIKNDIEGCGEIKIDSMGNMLLHKKGAGKKVMLAAHMDEVGFIVSSIREDGRIFFKTIGGMDPRALIAKRVVFGRTKILGVIGSKPVHLMSEEERKEPLNVKSLFIDIGADSREEAVKYVRIGDYIGFESNYEEMGDFIKAKALDDRIGCAIIAEILKENYSLDLHAAFTVQEENGLRGAGPAACAIEPEIALIIEGTTCADTYAPEDKQITTAGAGPAISLMDGTSAANTALLKRIIKTAEDNGIPYQYKRSASGGNDGGAIHKAKSGCLAASISVPVRYIHTPISMAHRNDIENALKLVKLVLRSLEEGNI